MVNLQHIRWEKVLEKLKQRQIQVTAYVIGSGFIMASVVSTLITFNFMPSVDSGSTATKGRAGVDEEFDSHSFVGNAPTLADADIKKIYERNIFNKDGKLGDVDPSAEGEDNPEAGPQKTDLPIRLLGVIYGGTPFNGLATIENTQKSKINSFIVGDFLQNDAKITEIHRTRVLFTRNNRKEYVELEPPIILRSKRQLKQAESTNVASNSSNIIAPIARGPALKNYEEEGFSSKNNSITMSESYKQKLLTQDFTKVLQDAKATPNVTSDGQIRGFRLTRIREGSIYQKAGLQNEDVVEEINGTPLSNAAAAIRLLQSLRNEKEVEVQVNRGGTVFSMKMSVQ